ncbi:hypothetical protein [Thalassovita aquimarina]|uniref:Uncharacterized protein n=1 Tax=Thalassovita aquimarina TaxID=2785917 RepID=A0ABS5HRE6_9RHOB|nr:hypothetical protein [Thalassovita aquimarina]MBR9651525.1 hypothetical protein [Thalassovita aquimarina]
MKGNAKNAPGYVKSLRPRRVASPRRLAARQAPGDADQVDGGTEKTSLARILVVGIRIRTIAGNLVAVFAAVTLAPKMPHLASIQFQDEQRGEKMYLAYTEKLEQNRIAKSVQRILLNGAVLLAAMAAIGVIGWAALGASLGEASIVMPAPPELLR